MTKTPIRPVLAGLIYVALIVTANLLTTRYGLVPVGLGLSASAGVFAAGATLTVRDVVQVTGGRPYALALIAVGAGISAAFGSGRIALASAAAFLLAELLDLTVFTWLRDNGWTLSVWASFAVAAPVDTLLFLSLAGFPVTPAGVAGQILGKTWATLLVWAVTVRTREAQCSTS